MRINLNKMTPASCHRHSPTTLFAFTKAPSFPYSNLMMNWKHSQRLVNTWGCSPQIMRWIILPWQDLVLYMVDCRVVWINGLRNKTNVTKLGRVRWLADTMISGAQGRIFIFIFTSVLHLHKIFLAVGDQENSIFRLQLLQITWPLN